MPRIDSISSVASRGHSSCAARSSAALNEPLRRLPAIPMIRIVVLACALGGDHVLDQPCEPHGAGSGILAVREHEVKLHEALCAAFGDGKPLERARAELAADA